MRRFLAAMVGALVFVVPYLAQAQTAYRGGALLPDGSNATLPFSVGGSGWLEAIIPNTESISAHKALSTKGWIGGLGACRTSDSTQAGAQGCQGSSGFAINNNSTQVQTAYAGYHEARRYSGAGITHGDETNIINRGSVVTLNSYAMTTAGLTAGYWVTCGRPDVLDSTNCSAALGVKNNGAAFMAGVVYENGAIATDGTGTAPVAKMAIGQGFVWSDATGATASIIRSDSTAAANSGCQIFADSGWYIQKPCSVNMFRVNTVGIASFGSAQIATSMTLGSTTALTLASGEMGFIKNAASGSAPGALGAKEAWTCGTNAGTAKKIAYAGTSTTPVTIIDNVGSGVAGC